MRVRVLGEVALLGDEGPVTLPNGKPTHALAALALADGAAMSADRLVEALWGEGAPDSSRKTLQVHVSALRKSARAAGVDIVHVGDGYRLAVAPDEIDAVRFERLAARGFASIEAGAADQAAHALEQALALWTGEPLSNVLTAPFAAHEADRLALRRLSVHQARIDADLHRGRGPSLVDETAAILADHPYDERACMQHMHALYRAGRSAEALGVYQQFRSRLGDELGLEPGDELADLELRILNHDSALRSSAAATAAADSGGRLPIPVSRFVGRERELVELSYAVSRARLVTLTGPGGVGKTRLAIEVAAQMAETGPGEIRFVQLADLDDPALLVATMSAAFGGDDREVAHLAGTIGDRAALLIADNCEHLIEAVAVVIDGLLRRCQGLTVVATSREPLDVSGEYAYRVPPLGLPEDLSPASMTASDAVTLFVDRAKPVLGDPTIVRDQPEQVAAVVSHLDGLPLAIELAAATLRTLPLRDLASSLDRQHDRLRGHQRSAPARHRTLEALIDWSYELLSSDEQHLLAQLSVFAGGFTPEAADHICESGAAPTVDVLAGLVDKSLVEFNPATGRHRLLETTRTYAAARVAEAGDAHRMRLLARHADHYVTLAERAHVPIRNMSTELDTWMNVLVPEHENLRLALSTLAATEGRFGEALRCAWLLLDYWWIAGRVAEGATLVSTLVELDRDCDPDSLALGLAACVQLWDYQGEPHEAEPYAARLMAMLPVVAEPTVAGESLLSLIKLDSNSRGAHDEALARVRAFDAQRPDPTSYETFTLRVSEGHALMGLERLAESTAAYESALSAAERFGGVGLRAGTLINLSCIDLAVGRYEASAARLEEADRYFGEPSAFRDPLGRAILLLNLGHTHVMLDSFADATECYVRSLDVGHRHASRVIVPAVCLGLAYCVATCDGLGAASLLGYADATSDDLDAVSDPTEIHFRHSAHNFLRRALGDQPFETALATGARMDADEAVALACSLAERLRS